jgi:hypothetical protein
MLSHRGPLTALPTQPPLTFAEGPPLPAGQYYVVPLAAQHVGHHIAVIPLQLDDAALGRPADAATPS